MFACSKYPFSRRNAEEIPSDTQYRIIAISTSAEGPGCGVRPRYVVRNSHGQQDREAAALADLAFDADRAVVRLDELLGDGQPQSAALYLGARYAEIAFENALVVTRVDAPSETRT